MFMCVNIQDEAQEICWYWHSSILTVRVRNLLIFHYETANEALEPFCLTCLCSDFYSGRCIQVSSCLIAQIVISKITCLSNQLEVLIWVNTIIFDVKMYDILQSIYSKCPGRNPLQQHLHTKLSDLFLYSEGFQRKHGLVYYDCWYVLIQGVIKDQNSICKNSNMSNKMKQEVECIFNV